MKPRLRIVAWNCRHGSLTSRLSDLAELASDIVFLQECLPAETLPLVGQVVSRRIGPQKGIALGSLNPAYSLEELEPRPDAGKAAVAAAVSGPLSFAALGIAKQHEGVRRDGARQRVGQPNTTPAPSDDPASLAVRMSDLDRRRQQSSNLDRQTSVGPELTKYSPPRFVRIAIR